MPLHHSPAMTSPLCRVAVLLTVISSALFLPGCLTRYAVDAIGSAMRPLPLLWTVKEPLEHFIDPATKREYLKVRVSPSGRSFFLSIYRWGNHGGPTANNWIDLTANELELVSVNSDFTLLRKTRYLRLYTATTTDGPGVVGVPRFLDVYSPFPPFPTYMLDTLAAVVLLPIDVAFSPFYLIGLLAVLSGFP